MKIILAHDQIGVMQHQGAIEILFIDQEVLHRFDSEFSPSRNAAETICRFIVQIPDTPKASIEV